MENDYYQVLGVSPSATLDEIRAAYRRRTRECHPDRGGTHEQMVLVNEAWEVLSNVEMRRRYDEVLAGRGDESVRSAADGDRRAAHQKAQDYPRQWADFERWLDGVTADFARAKYAKMRSSMFSWPTAGESVSGWTFIIVGAAVAVLVTSQTGIFAKTKNPFWPYLMIAAGGAWLGRVVHEVTRYSLGALDRRSDKSPSQVSCIILPCPQCGQKLRLPNIGKEVAVTCTACRHHFSHISDSSGSSDPVTQDLWRLRQQLIKDPHNYAMRKAYLAARTDLMRLLDDGTVRRLSYLITFGVGGAVAASLSGIDQTAPMRWPLIGGIIGSVCGVLACGNDEKTRAYYKVRDELGPLPEDAPRDVDAARRQFFPADR